MAGVIMSLNLPTLFVIIVFVCVISALLLLLSWLQSRSVRALALWAAAFLIGSVAVALVGARGDIPDVWSIAIANAVMAAAYGIMWAGARNFDARTTPVPAVLGGAALWLLACQFEPFVASPEARTVLMSAVIVFYSLASACELWRGRDEELILRSAAALLLLVHATFFLVRIPLAGRFPLPTDSAEPHSIWWTFVIFEGVFFAISITYLFGALVKERVALGYRRAALVDPLTGVGNRRAFFERGEKLLQRCAFDRRPAALLLFDLDKFKHINDAFGHDAGDKVLTAFCDVATATLRPDDLFGRLGGEEFASLLPATSLDQGLAIADRIRAGFAVTRLVVGADALTTTVSVGVATSEGRDPDLARLMLAADAALYRAKAAGRNRVEYASCVPEAKVPDAPLAPSSAGPGRQAFAKRFG
jgi:diguanylate cyclase (GGDEF)-like protein